jgi:hypothetical protein
MNVNGVTTERVWSHLICCFIYRRKSNYISCRRGQAHKMRDQLSDFLLYHGVLTPRRRCRCINY